MRNSALYSEAKLPKPIAFSAKLTVCFKGAIIFRMLLLKNCFFLSFFSHFSVECDLTKVESMKVNRKLARISSVPFGLCPVYLLYAF